MTRTIDARALKAALRDGGELALLDVREAGQFGMGHMLHAVPCPYSVLEARAPALAPRRSVRAVLADDGDGVAAMAAARLEAEGYSDVSVLDGGTPAWRAAGFEIFQGVNVPSKAFGEVIEHAAGTPRVTADELAAMTARGDDLVVLDGRTPAEHRRMSVPGAMSVPNGELVHRVRDLAPDPGTTVVVNCAGRTRSIIGAQTLIDAGIPNRVAALENGTMGWTLSGRELEHGSGRRHPRELTAEGAAAAAAHADRLVSRFGIPVIDAETLGRWRADPGRTLFLLDARPDDEFAAGTLAGAVHAPGGQLVQATDQWCGVWGARIVLFDTPPGTRAVVAAHWLRQMGWDASVLRAPAGEPAAPAAPRLPPPPATISTAALADALARGEAFVVDAGHSMDYREAHVPGAVWAVRPRLGRLDVPAGRRVVVCSGRETRARLAARDLAGARPAVLAGGRRAWIAEGRGTASSPDAPSDEEAIDVLFWTAARHRGGDAAARAYLDWERGLPAQVAADGDARFALAARRPSAAPPSGAMIGRFERNKTPREEP